MKHWDAFWAGLWWGIAVGILLGSALVMGVWDLMGRIGL